MRKKLKRRCGVVNIAVVVVYAASVSEFLLAAIIITISALRATGAFCE